MEWLYALSVATVVGLQGWILIEIIGLKVRTENHKAQLSRVVSDIESEKGTRKRLHDDFEARLRALENRNVRK